MADFAAVVQSDPKLSKGFHAVGLSQGGLIVRAYVELYNNPPVVNLLSLCGPQVSLLCVFKLPVLCTSLLV